MKINNMEQGALRNGVHNGILCTLVSKLANVFLAKHKIQ
jgi:hypothetical protein